MGHECHLAREARHIMTRALRWNVRNRLLVAFLIVAVVPLVVFGTLVYMRTSNALSTVEHEQILAQSRGTQEVLRNETKQQASYIRSYSLWNDFHHALRAHDQSWVATNVTRWVPVNSRTNLVMIYSMSGALLSHGRQTVPDDLWGLNEVQSARRGVLSSDLEAVDGHLYVIAAAPVLAQSHPSSPAAILVFGEAVTGDVLKTVSKFTGEQGRLAVYTDSKVSAASDPSQSGPFATFRPADFDANDVFHEGNYTSQLVALTNKRNVTVSLLKVSVPRQVFTHALGHIGSVTLATFALALVVALLMGLLVAQTISNPLGHLATAATRIAHGDLRQSLRCQRSDEIGSLAKAFNIMSERVSAQVDDLSHKTQSLALEISNLSAFGTTLAQTPDPHAELRRLADMIRGMHEADTASVFLVYEGHMTRAAFSGSNGCPVPSPAVDELAAWVIENRCSLEAPDADADAHLSDLAKATNQLKSLLVVPMARQEGVVGALAIGFSAKHEFGPEELPLLTTIGGQIAIALQNAEAYEKLDRMYLETVTALAAAMEAKDQYTASHADSLATMAVAVGGSLGMSDTELRMLQYAAVLHDIGKIGIPGSILNKPDKLTREEFETMAQHTVIGERIISRIDYLVPIARIIRSAHERWDGAGYPDGLVGEDIPLAARILLVCDAYDAMTTDRPYRRALPIETALNELSANAGSQFDPRVVDVFLAAFPFKEVDTDRLANRMSLAGFVEVN
jgi:HD-GYP domain-containing protein (c-di-GMP phosphodiesterase class II)/HAMP domain-containing protein/sensor domain CHASE-containing protein